MKRLIRILLCILPVAFYFSYFPVISLGSDATMNFELSIPLIVLVIFDVVALIAMIKEKVLVRGIGKKWWVLLFPLFATLSILWSFNTVRGILTCGIMWALVFAAYAIWQLRALVIDEKFKRIWLKVFFGASLVMCTWCVVQCILDVAGVTREYTLLCAGCTYKSFGFPHPNGFAIEPQFMGNLLLAPAIMSAWLVVKQKSKNQKRNTSRGDDFYNGSVGTHTKLQFRDSFRDRCKNYSGSYLCFWFLLFCFTATLFLTFSRGAIYAFMVAMAFLTALSLWSRIKRLRAIGAMWLVIVLSFVVTLNIQGLMAEIAPTTDTYQTAVAKVLNHLSLGIIKVQNSTISEPENNREEINENQIVQNSTIKPDFDGYVEESTEVRKEMTENAIKIWRENPKNLLVGVGIGGAGVAMHEAGLTEDAKEIVQNQYASLLLEMGLVGVILIIATGVGLICVVVKRANKNELVNGLPMVAALVIAYGVSLIFFAGLPNALHIYIMPVLLMVMCDKIR